MKPSPQDRPSVDAPISVRPLGPGSDDDAPLRVTDAVEPIDETAALVAASLTDSEAFAALIGRYERMALAVAYGVLADAERSGDVVQEAFLRAWQHLGDLKEPGRFGPWLSGIVRNLAIDLCRRGQGAHGRMISLGTEMARQGDDASGRLRLEPSDPVDLKEQRQLVADAMAELDETSRSVLAMRYYDNLSSKEIAAALEIAPAAVDMRLMRARQQLRRRLEATQAFAPTES